MKGCLGLPIETMTDLGRISIPAARDSEVPVDPLQQGVDDAAHSALPVAPENGLAQSLEKRRLQAYLTMVCADVAILLGSFALSSVVYLGGVLGTFSFESGMLPAYLLLPLFLTIALYNGSYTRRGLTDWKHSGARAVLALFISAALLNFLAFFAKANADFSRVVLTSGLILTGFGLLTFRMIFARFLAKKWGPNSVNLLVIRAGGPAIDLPGATTIAAAPHGLRPDGDDPAALDRLASYLRNMDQVIVSCSREDREAWAEVLKGAGIRGEIVDQAATDLGALGVQRYKASGFATMIVSAGHLGIRARITKRGFDLALSIAGLLLLSPVLLVCAALIWLEDGRSIFFRQRRMGRGNSFFEILKFRTMRECTSDADGARSASKDDDRITRVGKVLRRTSLDELPQLINVVKGEMSLVGPRPHALGSQAGRKLFWQVEREYWQRHSLRPGITGLAQVRGHRGATDTEEDLTNRLRADLEYVQGWSLWRDVTIVASTIRVLVHDRAF